jgi:tRNA threonylcarbamoyladenosine biosynthesis protein TsaE
LPTLTSTIETHSPAETLDFGREIGRGTVAGSMVVLDGALGAGKTVLAHGIALGLEIAAWRGSPTYSLIHEYAGRLPYFHIDAYRITPAELIDLDFERLVSAHGVIAIEWGAKMLPTLRRYEPAHLIRVRVADTGESTRVIEIEQ